MVQTQNLSIVLPVALLALAAPLHSARALQLRRSDTYLLASPQEQSADVAESALTLLPREVFGEVLRHCEDLESLVSLSQSSSSINGLCRSELDTRIQAQLQRLAHEEESVRDAAVAVLCKLPPWAWAPAHLDALFGVLGSGNWYTRETSIEVLGKLPPGAWTSARVDALIGCLYDVHGYVRTAAVEILGTLPSEKYVDALIGRLGGSPAQWKYQSGRKAVIEVLSKLPPGAWTSARVAALISRGLDDGHDGYVRDATVKILGTLPVEKYVDTLIGRLGGSAIHILDDEPGYVRFEAINVLGTLPSEKWTPAHVDALIGCLNDEHGYVRYAAIKVLGTLPSEKWTPAHVNTLVERLTDEVNCMRAAAIKVLGKQPPGAWTPARVDALALRVHHEDDESVRSEAVKVLDQLPSEVLTPAAIKVLASVNWTMWMKTCVKRCSMYIKNGFST